MNQEPSVEKTVISEGSGTNTILIVLVIIILLVGAYFLFGRTPASAPVQEDEGAGLDLEVDFPDSNNEGNSSNEGE